MMEPVRPPKKPNGCWWWSGCLLTAISVFLIIVTILLIFDSEEKMEENRAEYAASNQEYEEALRAYEADSLHLHAEYQRVLAEIDAAKAKNDSMLIDALQDSLLNYAMPEFIPRGHIGFNIATGFYVVFIIILLIPLSIGLLIVMYYRYKKNKSQEDHRFS